MPQAKMRDDFSIGKKVLLKSFNGTLIKPAEAREGDDFWRLIGTSGTIVEPVNERGRVLIQFDESIAKKGLNCHNPVANSLYILTSDLRLLGDS